MATYYVRTDGNNANAGTTNSSGGAWATIAYATSNATTSGDIIHVVTGTHTVTTECSLAVGVSLIGDGYTNSIINSTQTGTWSVFLSLDSGVDGTNGNQHISGLTLDGGYVSESNVKTWVGIWITARSNVKVHDCRIKNWKQTGTIFNGITTTNPGTDSGYTHATGNEYYNNITTNSSAMYAGTGQGALMIGFQNGMRIYNNTIQQTERVNFANGWPIKYWNQGWLKGCKIYDNILTKIPYSGSYPGENGNWDFAIEFFNIQGLEISGNTIQGSIDLNYNYKTTYSYSVWIHHNNISHVVRNTKVEGGVILEFRTESAIIEYNTFNNKTYGVTFNTRGPANYGGDNLPNPGGQPFGGYSYLLDNIIRNNLFINFYVGTGIGNRFFIGVISEGTDDPQINNFQIYNNTMEAYSGDPINTGIDLSSMPNGNGQGIYIRNNISKGLSGPWLSGSNTRTSITGCTVTHNDVYQCGNGNLVNWPAGNPVSYTYNNNVSVNPLFVGGSDYTLQPTSTLIDTGVNVGTPYYGSAPDIGYAEYNNSISVVTMKRKSIILS